METLLKIFLASLILFIVGFMFFFGYAFFYSIKLNSYLKREKYDRWCELTTIGNFGPGLSNPLKGLPYIYSELDNENEYIRKNKDNIRFGLRQSLFILIALVVNSIILAVLIVNINQ